MRNGQGAMRASDKVAGLLGPRVDRIFPAGQLPGPWRNDRIRHGNRGKNAVLKSQKNSSRLLHGIAAKGAGLVCLSRNDIPQQISKVIDVVYEVQKYGTRTLLPSPWDFEVIVRLVKP